MSFFVGVIVVPGWVCMFRCCLLFLGLSLWLLGVCCS